MNWGEFFIYFFNRADLAITAWLACVGSEVLDHAGNKSVRQTASQWLTITERQNEQPPVHVQAWRIHLEQNSVHIQSTLKQRLFKVYNVLNNTEIGH